MNLSFTYIEKNINLSLLYLIVIFIKLFIGFYTPVNILGFAPHDDTLFFRLAENISNYNWLGDFENTTLIKGPIYPLFLSFSITTGISLRVLESLLICFASLYFVKSLSFLDMSKVSYFILFFLLVNYPFQYSPLDYRLLRDMIYPWILLLLIAEIFFFYNYMTHCFKNPIKYDSNFFKHSLSFSFYLFLFLNIREEGIWIFPTLLTLIFFFLFSNLLKKYYKRIIFFSFSIFFILLFLLILNSIFSNLNKLTFNYSEIVEFKDKNYVDGYSSLYRFQDVDSEDFDPRIGITKKTWKKLFEHVPSLSRIEPHIHSSAFLNWLPMGCETITNQRPPDDSRKINCQNEMTVGFQIFAFRDAVYSSGLNDPSSVSNYMSQVSKEIDLACADKNRDLKCNRKISNMLPPWNFSLKAFLHGLNYFNYSAKNLINSSHINISNIHSSGTIKDLSNIANKLNIIMFDPNYEKLDYIEPIKTKNYNEIISKLINKNSGYADSIYYDNYSQKMKIGGWSFLNVPADRIYIFSNKKNICETIPEFLRPDITNSFKNVGFLCNFEISVDENIPLDIEIFSEYRSNIYKIELTENVSKRLFNKFDEDCFIDNNNDIQLMIERNKLKKSDLESYWKKYLSFENLSCSPLTQFVSELNLKKIFLSDLNDFRSKIPYFSEFLYKFYYFLLKFMIIFLPILIYINFKSRSLDKLVIIFIFSSLALSRTFVISILDFTGMAPMSPLYLSSGTFSYYVLVSLIFVFFLNYIKKRD